MLQDNGQGTHKISCPNAAGSLFPVHPYQRVNLPYACCEAGYYPDG